MVNTCKVKYSWYFHVADDIVVLIEEVRSRFDTQNLLWKHVLNILTLHPNFTGWFRLASPHQRMLWTPAVFTCLFLRHIGFIKCWLQLSHLISHSPLFVQMFKSFLWLLLRSQWLYFQLTWISPSQNFQNITRWDKTC